MELTLLWAALTAFGAAYLALRLRPHEVPNRPLDRLIGAAVVGMFAGRLAAVLAAGINPIAHPGQLLLIRGGVDTMWASVAGFATLVWPLRRNLRAIDNLAPAVLAALGGWHAGCVWRSTCLGTASDLPWAWALPGSDVTRHPVELYAAIGLAAGAFLLARLTLPTGTLTGLAISWAAVIRLLSEPMRPSIGGGPVAFYVGAAVVGVVVIAVTRNLPSWIRQSNSP
jgi:prolipoprotein diacylglyceryltransferase